MNLKIGVSNGRTYLSIAHGYRDENGKVKTKTIKSLGYLDVLQKEFPDPIAHFKNVVAEMNKNEAENKPPTTVIIDVNETLALGLHHRKNLGYAALSKIYHELDLPSFFNNNLRGSNVKFSVNSIMKLLIFSRLLAPASKKKTFEDRNIYFENFDFALYDVYHCLTFINNKKNRLLQHLHNRMKEQYKRETKCVYYDVTNYYFEIDEPDDLRKKGVSKEHKPNPIVQMGLFMDSSGMPITYGLFPGNTHDCETMIPLMMETKQGYDIGRIIVVADKAMNTARNIHYNLSRGDGYVYSQKVRGGKKEFKNFALTKEGYREPGNDGYKIKSRLNLREIKVITEDNREEILMVNEKQVIFYSPDYDRKAEAERATVLAKARDIVNNPSKYNKLTSYGACKYVKNLQYDKKTGEIVTTKQKPVFDEERVREEEKFDGYYAIVTSEREKTDDEIIEIYRGLWKIEETFKLTKSDLEVRPVYLSREDRICAHFLICFLSLLIARILERRLGSKYSFSKIANSLAQASGTYFAENWYVFDFADEITEAVKENLDIDLSRKYLRLGDIKNILAYAKKD
jgi:transposase